MEIDYKEFYDDDLQSLRFKQIQMDNEDENSSQDNENINYLNPEEFIEFLTALHDEISYRSSESIKKNLINFFTQITYSDENSIECKKVIPDCSLFLDKSHMIAEDILICLKDITFDDDDKTIFDFIEYVSGQSPFFVETFLEENGIDYIISHVNHNNDEIVLKSIQLLGEYSIYQQSYQKLVNDEFISIFFQTCVSLFRGDRFKNIYEAMAYFSSFLLRQIIRIIVNQFDQKIYPLQQSSESEKNPSLFFEQQSQIELYSIERIVSLKFYDVIWGFFNQDELIPYSQSEAIETFMLLSKNPHFVTERFPLVLSLIPGMIKENKLNLQNKINMYNLITNIYKKNPRIKILELFIDPDQSDQKSSTEPSEQQNKSQGIPWDCLIESISSDDKKEAYAAFDVLQALFEYSMFSFDVAFRKGIDDKLIKIVDSGIFNIKEKALKTIFLWISCYSIDEYNKSFVSFDFLEFIFPLLETDDKNLNFIAQRVIMQIIALNSRFQILDQEILDQYDERLKEIIKYSDA